MRFERVRKVLLDPQHLGGLITVHRATYIALNAEGAIERWNRHVSIGKAKRDAVFEQEVVHQVIHVVLAKDDPAVVAIFPHTSPPIGVTRLGGDLIGVDNINLEPLGTSGPISSNPHVCFCTKNSSCAFHTILFQTLRVTSSPCVGIVMERRATRRFRMKLPMRVSWATKSGNWEAQTESENITSRGVYFFLPTKIKKGSLVELVLVLPHDITLAEPVRVRCHGRVQRTEIKKRNRVGVAAEIESYQVLREDQNTGFKAQIRAIKRQKQS